jgi:hypothetical protein
MVKPLLRGSSDARLSGHNGGGGALISTAGIGIEGGTSIGGEGCK